MACFLQCFEYFEAEFTVHKFKWLFVRANSSSRWLVGWLVIDNHPCIQTGLYVDDRVPILLVLSTSLLTKMPAGVLFESLRTSTNHRDVRSKKSIGHSDPGQMQHFRDASGHP
jgi:hypothetical protein